MTPLEARHMILEAAFEEQGRDFANFLRKLCDLHYQSETKDLVWLRAKIAELVWEYD